MRVRGRHAHARPRPRRYGPNPSPTDARVLEGERGGGRKGAHRLDGGLLLALGGEVGGVDVAWSRVRVRLSFEGSASGG